MSEPIYIIGIDLGTTNSIIAYTETTIEKGVKPKIKVLEIPQLVGSGVIEKRNMLPSFIYVPGKHDVSEKSLSLPWDENNKIAIGEYAKDRGSELPQKLISSSKSWLCNTMVDRNKKILPWEGADEESKLSPIEASSVILRHLKDSWNYTIAKNDDNLKMENQEIFLTVPASFDAVARELTVKSAEMAGLLHVTLIEEPQAAFYAWIASMGDAWREKVKKGDLIFVCDIGGGTTDFTLIEVSEDNGELTLERIAVGNHLLIGGENMDLALAYSIAKQIQEKGKKLDSWQMRGLWHSCRNAKELIFSKGKNASYPVTILGRGSGLISGTIKTDLSYKYIEKIILDGFFTVSESSERPVKKHKSGIKEFGLSYESDPSVTKHMAQFLSHKEKDTEKIRIPTVVLFNGGIMKAKTIRERILEVLNSWKPKDEKTLIKELKVNDFDMAVARGAAYYGLARKGKGVRIRSGLSKTYYIGVEASVPAVPGMENPTKALCVAPFGMEEGSDSIFKDQEFALVVGEPVKFDFFGSSIRLDDKVGTFIEDWDDEIKEITTIDATLDGENGSIIPVNIEIKVTEVGTIEFWCVSKIDGKKWKLEFNVREKKESGND
ncbi:MAG: Hsp70 family protein [Desulfobacterales bacterium]|nr:Hsp70 family protein [Desulfobacterales bacterium]